LEDEPIIKSVLLKIKIENISQTKQVHVSGDKIIWFDFVVDFFASFYSFCCYLLTRIASRTGFQYGLHLTLFMVLVKKT